MRRRQAKRSRPSRKPHPRTGASWAWPLLARGAGPGRRNPVSNAPAIAAAAALGVSHPTILRDLRDHDQAEAEQVFAALAGALQRPGRSPPWLNAEQWLEARRSKYYRWHYTTELRRRGASRRAIARQVGSSPATVLRDLRRDSDWASDQADRADLQETRERLRERQAGRR